MASAVPPLLVVFILAVVAYCGTRPNGRLPNSSTTFQIPLVAAAHYRRVEAAEDRRGQLQEKDKARRGRDRKTATPGPPDWCEKHGGPGFAMHTICHPEIVASVVIVVGVRRGWAIKRSHEPQGMPHPLGGHYLQVTSSRRLLKNADVKVESATRRNERLE